MTDTVPTTQHRDAFT